MIDAAGMQKLMHALSVTQLTVVDVGARGGVDRRWAAWGDALRTIEFEPGETPPPSERGRMVLPVGISNRQGTAVLHVTRKAENSSCQRPANSYLRHFPQPERFEVTGDATIPVDTLDHALAEAGVTRPDFLKIDVQGHEQAVIDGAAQTLRTVAGVEIETAFNPIYDGQPHFSEVDTRLRQAGLRLVDLRPAYWKRTARPISGRGELVFADALYFADDRRDISRLILCALAYRKFDFALELTDALPAEVRSRVRGEIEAAAQPGWLSRHFRHAGRVARIVDRLSNDLKSRGWTRYDEWA
jgi:FkbM family methyltransferase